MPENNVREIHYNEGMFYEAMSVKYRLIINVSVNTNKTKGISVFSYKEYIKVREAKFFIILCCFSL